MATMPTTISSTSAYMAHRLSPSSRVSCPAVAPIQVTEAVVAAAEEEPPAQLYMVNAEVKDGLGRLVARRGHAKLQASGIRSV